MSRNEDRSGPRGPRALRRFLTAGDRVRSVITLVVLGCAAALLLTAVTGALATKKPGKESGDVRCVAGACPGPSPYGYPRDVDFSSVLALPSPPKERHEVFYAHGTPAGAENVHPTIPYVFGEGSDIFAATFSSGLSSWPADFPRLTGVPPSGMFLFLLRDADDRPVGFGVEQEMFRVNEAGEQQAGAYASDWIVSIPGRGVLWLNSFEDGGDVPDATRPDGSIVAHRTSGPLKNGRGVIVGGSGEFAGRTGTWADITVRKPGFPALGTFDFELHIFWDTKPTKRQKPEKQQPATKKGSPKR